MVKFSLLIPNLGYSEYFKKCIVSLSQIEACDDCDFEIIIYDQSDETDYKNIVSFLQTFSFGKLELIRGTIKSLPLARKELMKLSKGDYIIFIDSDDYVDSNILQVVLESLKRNNFPDILICSFDIVDENGRFITSSIPSGSSKTAKDDFMFGAEYSSLWRKVFRRKIYNESDYTQKDLSVVFGDDWILSRCLFKNAITISIDKEINYYNYRINPTSITHKFSVEWAYDSILMRDRYLVKPINDMQLSMLARSKFRQLIYVSKIFILKKMLTFREYSRFAKIIHSSPGFEKKTSWEYTSKGEKILFYFFYRKRYFIFWYLLKCIAKK